MQGCMRMEEGAQKRSNERTDKAVVLRTLPYPKHRFPKVSNA